MELLRATLLLAIVHHSLCFLKTKTREDDITRFLQRERDSVLEHEFVEINFSNVMHGKSRTGEAVITGTEMGITAFGERIDLWLHPKDSILVTDETPVYYAYNAPGYPGNMTFRQQYGLMRRIGQLMEDPEHFASLVIGTDRYGKTTVNGRIESEGLVVKSFSEDVVNDYLRKRRSIEDDANAHPSQSRYHIVYRVANNTEENESNEGIHTILMQKRLSRQGGNVPAVIYPKILVFVDFSVFLAQGQDIYRFLEYLLAFWNGVDLKYRSLENPKMRLHIAAFVIGSHPSAIDFISRYQVDHRTFEAFRALSGARKSFYEIKDTFPLKSYDLAATITGLSFGRNYSHVLGLAWLGTVCQDASRRKEQSALAIIRDNGAFDGVHVAAHELGHAFGASHDGDVSPECVFSSGFIMAFTPWFTSNSSDFSKCSRRDFQRMIDAQLFTCMYKAPAAYGVRLPNLMPGRYTDLTEQCSARGYDFGPCQLHTTDVCVNMHCFDSNGYCGETGYSALEGTLCSDENEILDRYCIHNQCVQV